MEANPSPIRPSPRAEGNGHPDTEPPLQKQDLVRKRWVALPVVLFILTCFSSYAAWWFWHSWRWTMASGQPEYWYDGFVYAAALLAILLTHEMGHFLQAVRYHVPASFPYFIPMPLTPIGTMGAIIGMQGMDADRKELFDIGISGPLAGLVVALPLCWIGPGDGRTGRHQDAAAFRQSTTVGLDGVLHSRPAREWRERAAQSNFDRRLGWFVFDRL